MSELRPIASVINGKQCREQLKVREDLLKIMCGTLYTRILIPLIRPRPRSSFVRRWVHVGRSSRGPCKRSPSAAWPRAAPKK